MSDMRKLLESMTKFAGQAVGQKPGDQVRGTDKASKKKSGKHPFDGRLVGCEESLIKDLEKDSKTKMTELKLHEAFERFKEDSSNPFVLYVNGKPASKYAEEFQASTDLKYLQKKYPSKKFHIKQEVCNLVDIAENISGAISLAETDDDGEEDYGPKYQAMAKRAGEAVKRIEKKLGKVDTGDLARRLQAAYKRDDEKEKTVKEVIAPVQPSTNPNTQSTNPNTQDTSSNQQKQTQVAQSNLSAIAQVDKNIVPSQANQAIQALGQNPTGNTPLNTTQMKQAKQLTDLVGDALSDPQKGRQVATILQQVAKQQGIK